MVAVNWAKNSSWHSWTVYCLYQKMSTHQETHRNTPGCIFPCFLCFGQENRHKCILRTLMPFLVPLCAPCDIIGIQWCHLVVGHTLIYILSKFEANQTNSSQDTAIFVSYPPVLLIWPLPDIPEQRHGLRTNPTAAHHPVCPGHSWCHY